MKTTIGFIGLGMMGAPMAMRLVDAGYTVHVFNRTKEKAEPLLKRGAQWCSSPADVSQKVDIIITMLTNDVALKSIATAIQPSLRNGGIHIDCSTVSSSLTSMLEDKYLSNNRYFLHSPVLGSIPQAADGSLLLFVGGNRTACEQAEPVLKVFGSKLWLFPMAEQASNMKLIMNSFIAGMIATLSQALVFAQNTGIDGTMILNVLNSSALNSPMYQTKGRSILEENFAPRFFLENLLKDTNLFRDAARLYSVPSPIADTVKKLLEEAITRGFGKEDYSSIVKAFQ